MLGVFARTLRSHVRRTVMTSIAVVIGVALIAGTLIFSDTINKSFDEIGTSSYSGVAAVVTPKQTAGLSSDDGGVAVPTLPRALVDQVAAVDGVEDAAGQITGQAIVFEQDGKTRLGGQGPPSLLFSAVPEGYGAVEYVEGRAPRADGEVVFDPATAEKAGAQVGDAVSIQGEGPRQTMRLVGLARLGDGDVSFGGATVAFTTTEQAAALTARTPERYYSEVMALGAPGVSDDELAQRIQTAVGDAGTVRTGVAQGAQQAADIKDDISFLPTMLLVFAGIATFVGAFLIFNTFSITVAQRQREFALLRALGASRRQVRLLVSGEALAVGLVGAVLGMLAGFVVAPGLRAMIKAFGADMPATGTVFAGRTLLVSLVVGVAVTMLASFLPARRATKVAPVEALREAAAPAARGAVSRRPVFVGVGFGVVGVIALLIGALGVVEGNTGTALAGGGAGLLFVAATLGSPALVGPLSVVVGRPLERIFGLPGRLARDNAARQPGRTAVTSGALMIGLALVVFATVFAAGLRDTLRGDLEQVVTAPVVLQAGDGGFSGMPRSVIADAGQTNGTAAAGGIGFGELRVGEQTVPVTAPDAVLLDDGLVRIEGAEGPSGAVRDPGVGRVYLTDATAGDLGLRAGDRFEALGANGHRGSLEVVGIVEGTAAAVSGVVMTERTAAPFGITQPFFVVVDGDRSTLASTLATDYPAVEVLTKSGWVDSQTAQVNQLLGLIYALLALSVIVALFGIVNTLTLSIQERIRELGLLRAVGATRRQVRRMVLLEAVITALLGAVLGAVLGFVLAAGVVATLDGFTVSVPIGQILGLVVLAAGLGVVAAIRPARRASKLDVLRAIADE
ncbi:MAG: ABC transporter permease [Patulibacter sp.]|nr:ABC transporter permease [Patulibacter sp.]